MAEIIDSKTILKRPGRYLAWPTVTKTPEGELIVAFSGDRETHTCPYGKTQLIRSIDGGDTWSDPETVNDTPLDDRDVGIVALADGTLLLRWFTVYCHPEHRRHESPHWSEHVAKIKPEKVERWVGPTNYDPASGRRGHWMRRSTDNGATWEEPFRVVGSSPKPPIELRDGRLLMIGNDGYEKQNRSSLVVVEESDDKGKTWNVAARLSMFLNDADDGYVCEPHLVETTPGNVVALARVQYPNSKKGTIPQRLHQADSTDGGKTWTEWRKTPMVGYPPHLLKLHDGRILATYGHRYEPFGQRACLSGDGGKTWNFKDEIILRDDAPNRDLGYPASEKLEDGTILTVYYQREKRNEKPCIMATRWRPGRPTWTSIGNSVS